MNCRLRRSMLMDGQRSELPYPVAIHRLMGEFQTLVFRVDGKSADPGAVHNTTRSNRSERPTGDTREAGILWLRQHIPTYAKCSRRIVGAGENVRHGGGDSA